LSKLDELIAKLCPDGVEYVALEHLLKTSNASKCIPKKHYRDNGGIPIIDQSQSYIAAYTDDRSTIPPVLPCIIFGDHTRVIKYADQEFAQGDSGAKVLIPIDNTLNTKYAYYTICNIDIPSRGYNRHWTIARKIKIPLPPLPIQQEIVRILDNFTELTVKLKKELSSELTARKKQYEYYRDKLLTFGDDVEWKELGEIGKLIRGSGLLKSDFVEGGFPCIHYGQLHTYYGTSANKTISFVSLDLFKRLRKAEKGDVLIVGVSENIEDVCKPVAWLGEEVAISGDMFAFRHSQNTKYITYLLQTTDFSRYKEKFAQGAKVTRLRQGKLLSYKVPLPCLAEQERTVEILDKFDALCNDLTMGLPAEIDARQKQYQYYRDKLLTFKQKT